MEPLRMNMLSDKALRLEFGTSISVHTNQLVHGFCMELEREKKEGIEEWVPSYTAVTIFYDPSRLSPTELKQFVYTVCESAANNEKPDPSVVTIPVCYGGEFGPDLEHVAQLNQLTTNEVIRLHTEASYLIYMIGFIPGFPYLGGMNKKIATPRLETSRIKVPAGSVGIAHTQTGVYPLESPGGWNLIGRTPKKLFYPEKADPVLLEAGTIIRFTAISEEEFLKMEEKEKGR